MKCSNCDAYVDFLIPIKREIRILDSTLKEDEEAYWTINAEWCPSCFNDEVKKIKWKHE